MRADILIPLVKAHATDIGCEVASLGVQVHGGMGFIEETGAAQHYRDARIAPIYEGTNGIQAADLVGRKLSMDNGGTLFALLAEMRGDAAFLEAKIVSTRFYLQQLVPAATGLAASALAGDAALEALPASA